jgi:hypothetical protein
VVRLSRAPYYRPPCARLVRAAAVTTLNEVVARHNRWGFWKRLALRLYGLVAEAGGPAPRLFGRSAAGGPATVTVRWVASIQQGRRGPFRRLRLNASEVPGALVYAVAVL